MAAHSGYLRSRYVVIASPSLPQTLSPFPEEEAVTAGSTFIHGLAEMKARRTESGAGLKEFLAANLGEFDPEVQGEINKLAERYVSHDE